MPFAKLFFLPKKNFNNEVKTIKVIVSVAVVIILEVRFKISVLSHSLFSYSLHIYKTILQDTFYRRITVFFIITKFKMAIIKTS